MKSKLLLLAGLAFLTALVAFRLQEKEDNSLPLFRAVEKKVIISCSPDWSLLKDWIEESDIPPIPGSGDYKWKISTTSDSAQFYFNQGINMYYSFHIIEAMASFKKAEKFDPRCAMLYWAQALTYGPNINDVGYAASPEALSATARAVELSLTGTAREKLLIAAQAVRYSADSTESREKLNQLYVDKMKEVYSQYPGDADVAALYADALMLQHPWDLWRIDGTPKPWTPLIREVLEKLLAKTPEHPGSNHYYIHVMEPSPYADKALPSADRLGKLTPGLSHTVHMPSHIYLRTGRYDKGVSVNENAINSYKKIIPLYAPAAGNDFLYAIHNLHMQTNNAMLAGRSAYSLQSAEATRNSIQQDYLALPGALGNYMQYLYMTPVLANLRFGNWENLLREKQPVPGMIYANILYHFGRGMAFNHRSQLKEAREELAKLQTLMKDSSLLIPLAPFSAAIDGATVAENILAGSIALMEKKFDEAVERFKLAVSTEEQMVYNEPRDWMLNPRHFLGNVYLKKGDGKPAEQVLGKDLLNNNENGWALFGLYKSLKLQKREAEAGKVLNRYKKAFSKADVVLENVVF